MAAAATRGILQSERFGALGAMDKTATWLLLAFGLAGTATHAVAAPQVWHTRDLIFGISPYSVVGVDLDGNGVEEIAVFHSAFNGRVLLVVEPQPEGTLQLLGRVRLADYADVFIAKGHASGERDRIVHVREDEIALISGRRLSTEEIFPLWGSPFAIGDLDGDGDLDMLENRPEGLVRAMDLATGEVLWTAPLGRPHLAQLDGDASLEVVDPHTGRVIDGASGDVKWTWNYVFQNDPHFANVDDDPYMEVLDLHVNGVVALGTGADPLWFMPLANAHLARVFDGDGDGRAELWRNAWSKVDVLEMPSGAVLQSVPVPFSTRRIVPGQFDQDPSPELVWVSSRFNVLDVASGESQALLHEGFHDVLGALGLVDLDADGRREVIAFPEGSQPTAHIWDHRTGARLPGLGPEYPYGGGQSIRGGTVSQLDEDPAMEIVLAGWMGVSIFDGATLQPQWSTFASDPHVVAGELDGAPSVIVLDRHQTDPTSLRVLDGETGLERWSTPAATGFRSVLLADVDGDGRNDLFTAGVGGVSRWSADGVPTWTVPQSAFYLGADAARTEVLASQGCCVLKAINSNTLEVRTLPPFATGDQDLDDLRALIPVEEGFALIVRRGGQVDLLDTESGATERIDTNVGGSSYRRAWDMVPGPHPLGWTLLISTTYGAVEFEVMSSQFIFGAHHGGFEDRGRP